MSDLAWKPKEREQVRWAARRDDGSYPRDIELLHRIFVPHDYQYNEKSGDLPDDGSYDLLICRADGHVILTTGISGVQVRATRDWLMTMYSEYVPGVQQAHHRRLRVLSMCISAFRHAEALYERELGLPDRGDGKRSGLGLFDAHDEADMETLTRLINVLPTDLLRNFRRLERDATPEQTEIVMRHVCRVLTVAGMEITRMAIRSRADPDADRMTEEEIAEWSIKAVDEVDRERRERADAVRRLERLAVMRDGLDQLRDELDAADQDRDDERRGDRHGFDQRGPDGDGI
ncbi:hypothetical protein SAE02_61720 [Skermanella aerolata]|uniref:Uncharacterized protein n=1 Tax=Skermanella aerolata TaxID=393310 RepID=A0A512DZW6_9PROT|nr:hypothetical protein [Skermanella aerolata]KJB91869.1 hypothetical protein N826_25470 [Skermanella aerolata KACC 11604]GEO42024.1 hypothetical protein SAE02_61720 [Skermanella aerolata]